MNAQNQLTTTDGPAGSLALDPRSAPFSSWSESRGVWPRLTHQEIFRAGWDAAIAAAVSHVKGQALTPEEIEDGTKWADDATEHIAEAMRRSLLPNAELSNDRERKAKI